MTQCNITKQNVRAEVSLYFHYQSIFLFFSFGLVEKMSENNKYVSITRFPEPNFFKLLVLSDWPKDIPFTII